MNVTANPREDLLSTPLRSGLIDHFRKIIGERDATIDNLRTALINSRGISTAVGVLMSNWKLTQDDAFALLVSCSQNINQELHVFAVYVTETGELPGRAPLEGRRRTRTSDQPFRYEGHRSWAASCG